MTPQVRFHIASCEEKLGRLVAALGGFELAVEGAEGVGPEFQKELEERIVDLRARVPKLVIERGKGAQAAVIELDGVKLGASSIGAEVPLDPGPHSIVAKALGRKDYLVTIEVGEQQIKKLTVELDEIPKEPEVAAEPRRTAPLVVAPAARQSRIVPYVLGGIGAAAIVNAGVFYLLSQGKDSNLQDLCGSDHNCNNANPKPLVGEEVAQAGEIYDRLRLYTAVSGVSAVVGIAALGVAGAWVIVEPKHPRPVAAWRIQPTAPGAELGGLSVVSAF
jgi:hypothetical protein